MEEQILEKISFEGTKIKINKNEFILSPLSVTMLHKLKFYNLQAEIEKAQNENNLIVIGDIAIKLLEIVYISLKMNYPNLERKESIELIKTKQLFEMIPALIDTPEGLEEAKNV